MASRPETLPAELLIATVEYLPRKERTALCLASKALRAVATPLLYETVELSSEIWYPSMKLGVGLLDPSNVGLRHVRHLCLKPHAHPMSLDNANNTEFTCRHNFQHLLLLLPRNCLRQIEAPDLVLNWPTLAALLTQQKALERISFAPMFPETLPHLNSGFLGPEVWSKLRAIALPTCLGSMDELEIYSKIIRTSPLLRSVCISTASVGDPEDALADNIDTANQALFPTLFPQIQTGDCDSMVALDILELRGIPIATRCQEITAAIDVSKLVKLRIRNCIGFADLLWELSYCFENEGVSLKTFWLDVQGPLVCEELDAFLCSFTGLRKLYISAGSIHDFDLACLENHRNTLEELAVTSSEFCGCGGYTPGSVLPWLRASATLPHLKQLGLQVPWTLAVDSDWDPRYCKALNQVLALPRLQTIRFFNWPDVGENWESPAIVTDEVYLEELDSWVRECFNGSQAFHPCERFPTLVVGSSWSEACCHGTHQKPEAVYYRIEEQREYGNFGPLIKVPVRRPASEGKHMVAEFDVGEVWE